MFDIYTVVTWLSGNFTTLGELLNKNIEMLTKQPAAHLDNAIATFDVQQHSLGVLGILWVWLSYTKMHYPQRFSEAEIACQTVSDWLAGRCTGPPIAHVWHYVQLSIVHYKHWLVFLNFTIFFTSLPLLQAKNKVCDCLVLSYDRFTSVVRSGYLIFSI